MKMQEGNVFAKGCDQFNVLLSTLEMQKLVAVTKPDTCMYGIFQ